MQAMENKKDIGKAFREKLDLLDRVPGNHVWDAIETDLDKKKKRRALPFWFILTDIATMALLLFFIASDFIGDKQSGSDIPAGIEKSIMGNDSNDRSIQHAIPSGNIDAITPGTEKSVSDAEQLNHRKDKQDFESNDNINSSVSKNFYKGKKGKASKNLKKENNLQKQKSGLSSIPKQGSSGYAALKKKNKKATNGVISNQNFKPAGASIPTDASTAEAADISSDEKVTATTEKDTVLKTIAKKDTRQKKQSDTTKTVELEEEKYKTFSVFLYARPTYFGLLDKKSSLDKTLDSLPIKSEIVYNYGGYLSFIYDEKWTVRAGIAKTILKYTTQDIVINNGFEGPAAPPDFYGVEYAAGVSNLGIAEQHQNSTSMDIEQELSYLEFPIELKYSFLKKVITIDGIGGISTLFLTDNIITAKLNNDDDVHMGMTRNIYKAHFNANLGVGFNYKFLQHFQLNVEPMFKYHFRTGEVKQKPYSFVVQAGIEYMFNSKKKTKTAKK
jgi:hypothetical protein